MSRLVILDRDGVLNRDRPEGVLSPDRLEMIPGAAAAVGRFNRAGWRVAVATNQSAVGRGLIDGATLARIHDALVTALHAAGARLDDLVVCTDHPDRPTRRRKPAPGMLEEILRRHGADPATTPLIGDALRDLKAAATVGCPRILVRTGKGRMTEAAGLPPEVLPVAVFDDLAAASDALLCGAA